jgi:uncharacterized protein with von Willebrand factor type A (vWA) domain
MIQRQTAISANMVMFCRFLRNRGFKLTTDDEQDLLNAFTHLPIGKESTFKRAARAVLVKNKWQFQQFDDLYTEFWDQLSRAVDAKTKNIAEDKPNNHSSGKSPTFDTLKSWLYNEKPTTEEQISAFSQLEVLTKKDFSNMTDDELRLVMVLLSKLAKQLAHRKSRLRKVTKKRDRVDVKRTVAFNMRRGGDLNKVIFSQQKNKRLKLVLICDVSKSMDLYSRFFVQMIYAFQNAYDKIETFVFSTSIYRISEILDNHEFSRAFDIVAERVPHWSGGTKIGRCFKQFYETDGVRKLDSKTIVFILSDGWDTGEPDILKNAMKNIARSSRKVIWLNPLAGNPNFSPAVTGLATALPYIDVMASAHNLDSLKQAMVHLKSRGKRTYIGAGL